MIKIKFAENLHNLRNAKHWTQDQLAKMINVDQRTISNWENQISEPNFETLARLCEIFEETFDNILT